MPNAIETLLSEIADYGEQLLRNRQDAQQELAQLLATDRTPFVNRVCQVPRGTLLHIAFAKAPA